MSIPVNRQTLYQYIRRRTKECWRLLIRYLSITRRHILGSSKLKEFADDNFKFDENGRKLSKRLENTVGKGEIARNEQFLFFPQCFQKVCFPGASKGVIVWECVNLFIVPFQVVPHCRNFIKISNFGYIFTVYKYFRV